MPENTKYVNFQDKMVLVNRWVDLVESVHFNEREDSNESPQHKLLRKIMKLIDSAQISTEQYKEAERGLIFLEVR